MSSLRRRLSMSSRPRPVPAIDSLGDSVSPAGAPGLGLLDPTSDPATGRGSDSSGGVSPVLMTPPQRPQSAKGNVEVFIAPTALRVSAGPPTPGPGPGALPAALCDLPPIHGAPAPPVPLGRRRSSLDREELGLLTPPSDPADVALPRGLSVLSNRSDGSGSAGSPSRMAMRLQRMRRDSEVLARDLGSPVHACSVANDSFLGRTVDSHNSDEGEWAPQGVPSPADHL